MSNDSAVLPSAPPMLHATNVQLTGTTWSLSMLITTALPDRVVDVGQMVPVPVDGVLSMSWPLAKAVSQVLQATIASYEDAEGPIVVPKSFQAALEKSRELQKQIDTMRAIGKGDGASGE